MDIFERRKFKINSFKYKKFVHQIYKHKRDNSDSPELAKIEKRITQKLKKYNKIYDIFYQRLYRNFKTNYINEFKKLTTYKSMKERLDKITGGKKMSYIIAADLLLKNYFLSMRYKFMGIFHLHKKYFHRLKKIRITINLGDKSLASRPIELIEDYEEKCQSVYELASNNFDVHSQNMAYMVQNINLGNFNDTSAFNKLGHTDDFNNAVCKPIKKVFQDILTTFIPKLEYLMAVLNVHLQYCNLKYYMKLPFEEFQKFYTVIYEEVERVEQVINY